MNRYKLFSTSLCLFAALVSSAVGQEDEKVDPTSPSPRIVQQEEAIRGLDRLKQLESELKRVKGEIAKLMQEREKMVGEMKQKDAELLSVKNEVQQKQALRDALPTFRLVGLVQTEKLSVAVVQAGARSYRVRDDQKLMLELSNGAKVQTTCKIKSADVVELAIPELSVTETITFHPGATIKPGK
ncbi:MAG: hypothetical protein AAF394_03955 [Planctomycetota bacterium]